MTQQSESARFTGLGALEQCRHSNSPRSIISSFFGEGKESIPDTKQAYPFQLTHSNRVSGARCSFQISPFCKCRNVDLEAVGMGQKSRNEARFAQLSLVSGIALHCTDWDVVEQLEVDGFRDDHSTLRSFSLIQRL